MGPEGAGEVSRGGGLASGRCDGDVAELAQATTAASMAMRIASEV